MIYKYEFFKINQCIYHLDLNWMRLLYLLIIFYNLAI